MLRRWRGLLALHRCERRYGHAFERLVESVRDESSRDRVFLACRLREVDLPDAFNTRRCKKDLHGFRLRAFTRSIVRDDDPWVDGIHEKFGIHIAMPCSEQQIDCADAIHRTHELELPVQSQIAEVNRSK